MESLRYYPSAPITAALRQFVPWQRPTSSAIRLDYLMIGGGGSGRVTLNISNAAGGGGGAGGYVTSLTNELNGGGFPSQPPLYVYKDLFLTVTVGAGGAAGAQGNVGNVGTNSALFQNLLGNNVPRAFGGAPGLGAAAVGNVFNGGGSVSTTQASAGGDATGGQNSQYAGGAGFYSATASLRAAGGGGGAGAVGSAGVSGVGGNGGAGRASSITGTSVTRAGGGGGSRPTTATGQGAGGSGGGGAAAYNATATSGTVNTGSGGGGASSAGVTEFSGAGGSGIVILRHSTIYPQATTTGSPTITTSGGFRIYQFTGSGSITF